MKKILLISLSILLLGACGNGEESENEEASEEFRQTEVVEESEESEDEKQELTEEEAEEKVRDYINAHEDYDVDEYVLDMEEKSDDYSGIIHAGIAADDEKGNPVLYKYLVDSESGEVKEVDLSPDDPEAYVSEVVSMSQEERNAHHREMAVDEESLADSLLEQLLLPGVHENTKTYEGRVNPKDTVEVDLVGADDPVTIERADIPTEVDEEGYFTTDLESYELEKNATFLRITVQGDYKEAQVFDVMISEAETGMEVIRVQEEADE